MAKNAFDKLMSVGIDIGKDTFHIVGFDPEGQLAIRRQIRRLALIVLSGRCRVVLLGWRPV
jgi:transposase